MTTVAVIIPYFQKREGILRRALDSVLQQRLSPDIRIDIIVVDDGSPRPAQMETTGLALSPSHNLRIIKQPNGGVGGARNTGLKNTDEGTDYIAFLDSDDIWHPDHLPTAIAALDRGCDFYFCDSQRVGDDKTSFSRWSFDRFLASPDAQALSGDLYELNAKAFFDRALRGVVFQTSASVYRRVCAPDLTFDTSLRVAGEDYLFLFQLLEKGRRVCCSTRLLMTLADGVNIYASKFSWDEPGHLVQKMGSLLSLYQRLQKLSLSTDQNRLILARIRHGRRLFAFLTLRFFIKYRQLWTPQLVDMIRTDQKFWLWYPLTLIYVAILFPLRLYKPTDDYDALGVSGSGN